ncbi:MAG TPA: RNA polymerase sigma factor [Kofleriaceae bacterium]|jgi:RNA polymerase sigma-70 factor (ECF subfamily)
MTTEYQTAWRSFLTTFEPLRAELYRYCRYLTRSPWDAEDLAQDALARGFATLAKMDGVPPNPRAWLFRVASNLWIDQLRKRRDVPVADEAIAIEPRAPREAAGTLLVRLSPQERAAVVLKDVFELSLDEIADALGTTVGTVKTALHRGRGKLVDDDAPEPTTAPAPGALDEFCRAFNAGDLDRLTALLLDTSVVEVVGATVQYGPEAARRTVLYGMVFGTRLLAGPDNPLDRELTYGVLADSPRAEARWYRDRWIVLGWYKHADGVEAVRAVTTLELDGDRVARLANYFYTSELLHDIGAELGVPIRSNGHRWWR